jgi:hypothetical protein
MVRSAEGAHRLAPSTIHRWEDLDRRRQSDAPIRRRIDAASVPQQTDTVPRDIAGTAGRRRSGDACNIFVTKQQHAGRMLEG